MGPDLSGRPYRMTTPLGYATIVLYGLSLVLYVVLLYFNKRWIGWTATVLLAGGIAVHWQALLERARAVQAVPYQDLVGSMSLFAWLLAVTYIVIETYHNQRSVGPFVLPCVLLLMGAAAVVPAETPPAPPPSTGASFAFHVTLNILAYSAFALAFVLSLIYLIQNHVLRGRRPGETFWRFPPLELLERMSRSSVLVGVASLTVGIGLGLFKAARLWSGSWSLDAKVIATLVTFVLYVTYLWLGRTTAWRGARASVLCVCNFLFVVFSYTVVNLFLSQRHRYF